jgi:hypothetical protein
VAARPDPGLPDKPVSHKPAETRMGKGKGADGWVCVIKPGRISTRSTASTPRLRGGPLAARHSLPDPHRGTEEVVKTVKAGIRDGGAEFEKRVGEIREAFAAVPARHRAAREPGAQRTAPELARVLTSGASRRRREAGGKAG